MKYFVFFFLTAIQFQDVCFAYPSRPDSDVLKVNLPVWLKLFRMHHLSSGKLCTLLLFYCGLNKVVEKVMIFPSV